MRCVCSFLEFPLKADLLWRFIFFSGESIPFLNSLNWIVVFFSLSHSLCRPANVMSFRSIRFHLGVVSLGYNTFCAVKGKKTIHFCSVCLGWTIFFLLMLLLLLPLFSSLFSLVVTAFFFSYSLSLKYFHIDCESELSKENEWKSEAMRKSEWDGAPLTVEIFVFQLSVTKGMFGACFSILTVCTCMWCVCVCF